MQHPVLDQIARTHVIDTAVAPAAVLGVASHGSGGWRVYTGAAGVTRPVRVGSLPRAVTPDTVFDLASVSKPFLAVLVTRLARRGAVQFDTPLGVLLAEARGTPVEYAPIEALLAHRAGLEAHLPLFAPVESRRALRLGAALVLSARSLRPDCRSGAQPLPFPSMPSAAVHSAFPYSAPLYSDLGYLLVGAALERVTGRRLDELFEQELFAPLALEMGSARQWLARGDFLKRVAPTEILPWRGRPVRGRVHDDNCWALAGHGCAGHAGLFAPVAALLQFGCTLVDAFTGRDESYLGPAELERLTDPRPGGTLRCGFDGKALDGSSVGRSAGPRTFGHLGFTGTSLWCDPDAGVVMVMLTNRVHPTRENPRIRLARPLVHEELFQLAQSTDGLN